MVTDFQYPETPDYADADEEQNKSRGTISAELARQQFSEILNFFEDASEAYNDTRLIHDFEAVSFVRGKQHHYLGDPDSLNDNGTIQQVEVPQTVNMVRKPVEAATATKMQHIPPVEVSSSSSDNRAMSKAEGVEQILNGTLNNGIFDWEALKRNLDWAHTCGLGFIKAIFNHQAGRDIPSEVYTTLDEDGDMPDEEGEGETDVFGEPVATMYKEGEVDMQFVPSSECLPNPNARNMKEVKHLFHVRLMRSGEIKDMYETDFFGKKVTSLDVGEEYPGDAIIREAEQDSFYDESGGSAEDDNTMAQIVEFWELPSRKYPNGRFAAFSGNILLELGPNFLEPKRLPFVPFYGDNMVPGSLYPDGIVRDLMQPQEFANKNYTKMLEHVELVANQHWLIPTRSGINKNYWGDKHGQLIYYEKGFKPEPLDVPPLPNWTFNLADHMDQVIDKVSGYMDSQRGAHESGDMNARAIMALQNAAQGTRAPDIMLFRRQFLELLQHILWLMQQYYEPGRFMDIMGQNGEWLVKVIQEEELSRDYKLIMQVDTGAPNTPAMKFAETLELMQYQILEDTPAAERARRMLGRRFSFKSTSDPKRGHFNRARREQVRLLMDDFDPETNPIYVAQFDDHDAHLDEHNEFRITPEYENLDEEKRMYFDAHCAEHDRQRFAQLQHQAMQDGLGGMPGGGGGGAVPDANSNVNGPPLNGGHQVSPTTPSSQGVQQSDPAAAAAQETY